MAGCGHPGRNGGCAAPGQQGRWENGAGTTRFAAFSVVAMMNGTLVPSIGTIHKHPRNPLLVQDRPWELRLDNAYPNVARLRHLLSHVLTLRNKIPCIFGVAVADMHVCVGWDVAG